MAEHMRRNMTPAETHLWKKLCHLSPIFHAQAVLYGYIADFCSFRFKIVVEIDGSSHLGRDGYDAQRDAHLKRVNYRTLRFSNEEVLSNRAAVLGKIIEAM